MDALRQLPQQWRFARRQKQHRLAQGRLTAEEAAVRLSVEGHIPLAAVPGRKDNRLVAVPADGAGHLLLVAPPDSGWREQLAMTLAQWPAAALVVDPGGYLYQQTGYLRQTAWGKVYAIPGYRFNLGRYYPLWNADAARRLLDFLMPPVPAGEEWLLTHLVALVQALGCYSLHHKRNPLQVLLDAANTDLLRVLAALETVTLAGYHARRFTKGLPDWMALEDPDVLHCFTFFTWHLQRYQKMYASFAMDPGEDVIPPTWIQKKGSLYLTFSLAQLPEQSGLAAALVDGLFRFHQTHGCYENLLLVMDAAFARQLPPIEQLLIEATAYGVTVILTADSLLDLHLLATDTDGAALAGRFAHQLWYPPYDWQTAAHMAWLYGTRLQQGDASGETIEALAPEALLAWPRVQVLVYTRRERPYRFLAQQVTIPADLPILAAPARPRLTPEPRDHLAWLPLHLRLTAWATEPLDDLVVWEDHLAANERALVEDAVPADKVVRARPAKPAVTDGIQVPLPFPSPDEDGRPAAPAEEIAPPTRPGRTKLR